MSCRPKNQFVNAVVLAQDEPPACEFIEGEHHSRLILICDHASNRFPMALDHLGVDPRYWADHIAWDIGAAGVTRYLRQRFFADAVLANYTRLVIDLNRSLGDGSGIPSISDGVLIAGNLSLDAASRAARADALHAPYHQAIGALIERRSTQGQLPVFIGIHSFTPFFHGTPRPWHAGVLWDRDPRLAVPLLRALHAHEGLVIGDNEPYSGRHQADYSIDTHAEARGMAHVGIEIRQDLIADDAGQKRWAEILGDALDSLLGDASLYQPLSAVSPTL